MSGAGHLPHSPHLGHQSRQLLAPLDDEPLPGVLEQRGHALRPGAEDLDKGVAARLEEPPHLVLQRVSARIGPRYYVEWPVVAPPDRPRGLTVVIEVWVGSRWTPVWDPYPLEY